MSRISNNFLLFFCILLAVVYAIASNAGAQSTPIPVPPDFTNNMYTQPVKCTTESKLLDFLKKQGAVPLNMGIMEGSAGKKVITMWALPPGDRYVNVMSEAGPAATRKACMLYAVDSVFSVSPVRGQEAVN
jgi:hypothetical protein